jgi:hypothetical protein
VATFIIVDKDKDPLEPGEINAGDTIDVDSGDIFIISASADAKIKFESATGNPTNFEIRFETSNANNFKVEITEDLDAGIVISNGADLADIDIDADKALSVVLTAGDNVSLGKITGSADGVDLLTIGDGFATDHDILLNGGDNFLSIGDNATIRKIDSEDGADTISIGNGLIADDIKTGDGADSIAIGDGAILDKIETGDGDDTIVMGDDLIADDIKTGGGADGLTIGDGAFLDNIETGKGDDTIEIGEGLVADDIKTGDGDDGLTIGDGAVVDDINTDDGNDTVSVGDDLTADKLETKDGDDIVIVGTGVSIEDLDGGKGNDTLNSDTDFPDANDFETICFARRTLIEAENGNVPIEALRAGDRIRTLDHGFQCIRWVGSTRVPGCGVHAPVRIAAGALGNARPLWVSQQHRMLLSGWHFELNFGEKEVLVAAKHLVGLAGISIIEVPSVEYFHMLFDQHEIVFSEGIESESFHPGAVGIGTLSQEARAELFRLFPSLELDPESFGMSARLSLRSFEAPILAA